MILDSKSIVYDLVDITEPGKEDEKMYMQTNSKSKDGSKNALPPQIFNDDVYCGVGICWNVVNSAKRTRVINCLKLLKHCIAIEQFDTMTIGVCCSYLNYWFNV